MAKTPALPKPKPTRATTTAPTEAVPAGLVRVRATAPGYINGVRRVKPGEVFLIPAKQVSTRWMERTEADVTVQEPTARQRAHANTLTAAAPPRDPDATDETDEVDTDQNVLGE
jgi:hypothetical protein